MLVVGKGEQVVVSKGEDGVGVSLDVWDGDQVYYYEVVEGEQYCWGVVYGIEEELGYLLG